MPLERNKQGHQVISNILAIQSFDGRLIEMIKSLEILIGNGPVSRTFEKADEGFIILLSE